MILHGYGELILHGVLLTVALAIVSAILAIVAGVTYSVLTYQETPFGRFLHLACLTLIAMPEFITLLLLYFAGTALLQKVFGSEFQLSPFIGGTLALGLAYSGYFGEVFRGALKSVPTGLIEAALSLGMRKLPLFLKIQAPIATRLALSGSLNLWVSLVKDTSIVSLIGVSELMKNTTAAARVTGSPFIFYAFAAALYFILTYASDRYFGRLIHRNEQAKEPYKWISI